MNVINGHQNFEQKLNKTYQNFCFFVAITDLIGFISQSTVKELWTPETIGIPKAQNLNDNEYGI